MELEVGMRIRIIKMDGEPEYDGREGTIRDIKIDPWGDTQLWGSWGGLAVYPDKDEIEILA